MLSTLHVCCLLCMTLAPERGLTEDQAELRIQRVFEEHSAALRERAEHELDAGEIKHPGGTLRVKTRVFGDAPEGERSLWISMHGGGGTAPEVNDQQWDNQIKLYEPAEGIYVAPRAPSNTWNMWHRSEIDVAFGALIDAHVSARGVDPDRVYLMGYSAGGDGAYQLAPRMADRFAAAAMMAGHPNDAKPLGLRNLPFAIFMGADDSAYNRNTVAQSWGERLAELRSNDAQGYDHLVRIYEGLGHWMQRKDAEALPWMASRARNPWPDRVVWRQDDVTHTRFYWLEVAPEHAEPGGIVIAEVEGQTITIERCDAERLTLRLRDRFIDLDKPIRVMLDGMLIFEGVVERTDAAVRRSLDQRLDDRSAATALLEIAIPSSE